MGESGPEAAKEGLVEDVKGKAKEVVGRVTGKEGLESEGKAQQDKADAARDVAEHEAKAEGARREQDLHEAEQRAQQGRKDD
jgi:uncharacterized protein YjbJ (UPF0337 family)